MTGANDPSPCDEIEIEIEKDLHGAASVGVGPRVAAHVAGCERCSAYMRGATASRRGLASLARDAREGTHWDGVEARLRRASRASVRRTMALAIVAPVAVALSLWGLVPPGGRLLVGVADALAVGAVVAWRLGGVVRASRRIARLSARDELFTATRAELEGELRRITKYRWLAFLVVASLVGGAASVPGLPIRARVTYALLGAIVAAVWTERLLARLPRLRRELTDLERA